MTKDGFLDPLETRGVTQVLTSPNALAFKKKVHFKWRSGHGRGDLVKMGDAFVQWRVLEC
jgi:hypothetical protein